MLLEARKIVAQYGRIRVLHGIDLDIAEGELVAIIGANGAGKTTLLRVFSGVQPLTAGRISFDGMSFDRVPPHRRVASGMIQIPEGRQIFGAMTVEDNILLGGYRRRASPDTLKRLYDAFPMLADRRRARASSLSGGQQQMLALARALMGDPRMLLLDEPSMGLAPLAVREIYDVILRLRHQGVTICLVEQNARAALDIADRAYVLENGTIALSGFAADLAKEDAIRRAYLAH
jgi:branched-chain amino acid transport system ATP-binding protein